MDRRNLILGAALAALSPGSGLAAPGGTGMQTFTSGGVPITVEWFEGASAASGGRLPAVLLLHGADGLTFGDGYRLGAQVLAGAGYHVAFVHYLDRTGERRVSYSTLRQKFPLWVATIGDALTWLAGRPGVDPDRLGIMGVSLGAALALEAASYDGRVKAIVDYFGPVPEGLAARKPRLPPTLILHGANDPIVPVSNAHALEKLLSESGTRTRSRSIRGRATPHRDGAARCGEPHLGLPRPASRRTARGGNRRSAGRFAADLIGSAPRGGSVPGRAGRLGASTSMRCPARSRLVAR
jgi:carboxymethylenebutenolidase